MTDPCKWKGNRREIGEDFFETPTSSIIPVLKYIPKDIKIVWEPTNGKDGLSKHLTQYEVVKTDKYPKTDDSREFDFLVDTPDFEYDFIMFNPPFSLKTQFLKRAIELGKPFLFICPVTIIETAKRSQMFHDKQLSIINLSNRTNYISSKGKKVWFHSVWVLDDGLGKIHYEHVN